MALGRRKALSIALASVALLAVAGGAAWYFLAPKPVETRSDAAPVGASLKGGTFQDGEPLHHASGIVRLLQVADGHVLRFEGYEATSGPDVYFYLTPKQHATTTQEVEGDGVKIRTPTVMGHATLRGDFNLDIPAGVDVAQHAGIAVWCDTYNVLFGYAELTPT